MLRVLFFARVREQLDCEELNVAWSDDLSSLDNLQQVLTARGEKWRQVLAQDNLIRAVNHEITSANHVLHDGDEVAFFPPVTGG